MSDYAVEVRDAMKVFSGGLREGECVNAVNHVSLSIRRGEFFTMLGPSGCGKTTTLRMIAGFETPTSGEIVIQGRTMTRVPPHQRPVHMVFQNYALFPHLTVGQNVAFALSIRRVPKAEVRERVRQALGLVQLAGMENRRPSQLSGGQQQRVALARALINRPVVLLLDEPLGALDLKLRKAMQLELKHLQDQVGITFIYVTHDQEEALTMSDRVAVMDGGQVLQVGAPVEIYEKPATRFVADFIGETNFFEGVVQAMHGETIDVDVAGQAMQASVGTNHLAVGQPVTVAIRPEKLLISAPEALAGPALPGMIQELVYIGTDTRYIVRLLDGAVCVARVQNTQGRDLEQFAAGDAVCVSWSARDARPLTV